MYCTYEWKSTSRQHFDVGLKSSTELLLLVPSSHHSSTRPCNSPHMKHIPTWRSLHLIPGMSSPDMPSLSIMSWRPLTEAFSDYPKQTDNSYPQPTLLFHLLCFVVLHRTDFFSTWHIYLFISSQLDCHFMKAGIFVCVGNPEAQDTGWPRVCPLNTDLLNGWENWINQLHGWKKNTVLKRRLLPK